MGLFSFYISFKGKEGPDKTKLMPAKLQWGVGLHAVLATSKNFRKYLENMDPRFPGDEEF